jgi:hypothetical protein
MIFLKLHKSLVGVERVDLAVSLPWPGPGTFDLVYDDAAAGYPKFGEVSF